MSLLSGWLAFRWSILTRSVLVSDLAPTADRIALAVVLGAVVAAAGLTVQWAGTPDRAGARRQSRSGPSERTCSTCAIASRSWVIQSPW